MALFDDLLRQVNDFGHEPLRKLLYASVRQLIAEIYAPAYVARHEGLCHYELAAAHHQSGSVVEHLFRDPDGNARRQGMIHMPPIPIPALSIAQPSMADSRWTGLTMTNVDLLDPKPLRDTAAGPSIMPLFETQAIGLSNPFTPLHRVIHSPCSLSWPTEAVRANIEHAGLMGIEVPPFELKVTVPDLNGRMVLYRGTMQQVEDPRVTMRLWPPPAVVHWHFTAEAIHGEKPPLDFVIEFS